MLTMTPATESARNFPTRAANLLSALRSRRGEWLTRNTLADMTGKRRLSPNDVHHLENMVRDGVIEVRTLPGPGVSGVMFEYRAATDKESS